MKSIVCDGCYFFKYTIVYDGIRCKLCDAYVNTYSVSYIMIQRI